MTLQLTSNLLKKSWLANIFAIGQSSTLPLFPDFKDIEYTDKDDFEKFVHSFDCYSDFNFNSFYSWNTDGVHAISQLNGNLILKFADYITGEPFYSFIGTNNVAGTIETLLDHTEKEGLGSSIRLIPDVTVAALENNSNFIVVEDPDNFDYIFSIEHLAELKGNTFKSKRRAAQKCVVDPTITVEDMSSVAGTADIILATANQWAAEKDVVGKEVDMSSEQVAITRVLERLVDQNGLLLTVAKRDGNIVGFSIDELLPNNFVLSHYFKALPTIAGLSEYLNKETAARLHEMGYTHWNWEQDLGIESLRRMKNSHRPILQHKKYTIKKARNSNRNA